ncbi:very long-chain acyl-CoA synthetase-like [Mizuhopecten yessoensis]|uniref:long-chain-fatty-acid--CoA ligase n=1 Tax=Mizuhopecten yessoensis TaxID=6573 RepID=A0A210QDS3_MIZYE|nr:very long-chain acyl-CoA synthetase-like [Mizuhopecten yessoensis]OWF46903.1 Very long-chain acyl-CoA synthetase [Mizuhopecten yessoensis]
MPSKTDIALGTAAGVTGAALVAWRALFPYLGDDIRTYGPMIKTTVKIMKGLKAAEYLVDVFERQVAKDPKKTFLIFEDKSYSFEFVNEMANKVASIAMTWNLDLNDTVATVIYNEPAFVWTFLGLQKVGLADAFINYHLTAKPLLHSLKVSEAKVIIVGEGDELLESILAIKDGLHDTPIYVQGKSNSELPPGFLSMEDRMTCTIPANICKSLRSNVTDTSPMCFIYTSGTTGLPKPAIINQAKGIATSKMYSLFDYNEKDVVYVVTPLYHSAAATNCFFNSIDTGATMVIRKKFSASHFWEDVRKHNVTVIQYIGELLRYIVAVPKSPLDGVHNVRVAYGNGLRPDIWKEFQSRFKIPWIMEMFGATEGTAAIVNTTNKLGAIGRLSPLANVMAAVGFPMVRLIKYDLIEDAPVRDKDGRCVTIRPGEQGLFISPIPDTHTGFYKGPKEMDEKKILRDVFVKGDFYFSFGDLVFLDRDYYIYFRDRVGDTFRWKGENVSTREVCDALSTIDFIHDVNVYGVHVPGTEGRAGMAAIALNDRDADVTSDMLRAIFQKCHQELPSYARPVFLRFQRDFIVTQTMKHRKVELVHDGFDPSKVTDPLYFIDNKNKTYSSLTTSVAGQLPLSKL